MFFCSMPSFFREVYGKVVIIALEPNSWKTTNFAVMSVFVFL